MKHFIFEKITKASGAFKGSRILLTANELDLFTHIHNGFIAADTLAKKIKANKDALERLLDALCALGLLVKRKSAYRNSLLAEKFLVRGKSEYLGDTLLHHSDMWKSWAYLTETVKYGQKFKNPALVAEKKKPRNHSAFIMAMHNNARYKAKYIAAGINLGGAKTLIDLGGGPGTYSIGFAQKNKRLNCVVYDSPETIAIAKKIIKKYKMSDRIKAYAGDFLADPLPRGFDVCFLSSIIHIYNEAQNLKILKKIYLSLNPGGKIIIKDSILDDSKTKPLYAVVFSINMLTATAGGSVYTENTVRQWLEAIGFKNIVKKDVLDFSIITGKKARGQALKLLTPSIHGVKP